MESIKQLDQTYIANTYRRADVLFMSGKGSILKDDTGKEYIDLGSGIAVSTFGIADEAWKAAVTAQLDALQHVSNLYYTQPQALLAQELCERTGMKKVFFNNSGAEANECMIKVARKYASDRWGEGHSTILTLKNSFHGRTITTLSATGQEVFHKNFGPFTPGFDFVEVGDLTALEQRIAKGDCCALMIELVQGEGGVVALEKEYVQAAAQLVQQHDMLLMIDEVQTGNGRTGTLYAYMQYGIQPDVISTAKGLAGGLPMGATMMGERVKDVLDAGSHGSTFGGNPVCAAGALHVLSRIDEALMQEVREKSAYIREQLQDAPGVKSVSGLGLMLGIETERPAGEVLQHCLQNGVVALTAKTKVRLLPALNIPWDVLKKAVQVLKEACAQ